MRGVSEGARVQGGGEEDGAKEGRPEGNDGGGGAVVEERGLGTLRRRRVEAGQGRRRGALRRMTGRVMGVRTVSTGIERVAAVKE